ncbi:hypothetical protein COC69_18475 [Bacillus cereus]|uniref:Uncharacterized protein n=1 Tax=Bacillus cereus TaxID=1396 RepID=A0A9X7GV38_BACCE|nr:hypothetical protein [Bacillus cereus]PGS77750.1 hypothetical protein COC69_18475 [Bacillus cereus]
MYYRLEETPEIARNTDRLNLNLSFANIRQLRDAISAAIIQEGAYEIHTTVNPFGGTLDPGGYPSYPQALTGKLDYNCEFWIYHDYIKDREYAENVVIKCRRPESSLNWIVKMLRTHPYLGGGRSPW